MRKRAVRKAVKHTNYKINSEEKQSKRESLLIYV